MENRQTEILACRQELRELTRRVDSLSARLDALEGKPVPEVSVPKPAAVVRQQTAPVPEEPPKHRNLENTVGRNLFAVLASVLVLLGVGVFISTIYEYIPQTVKVLAIYLFGGILLGAGLFLYRRNGNKFWLGVASCGLAELLVSIITSHSYFAVLSLPAAFGLVLVWIAGSFWLTRFHPTVFKTIGYIGFIISMILGLNLLENRDTLIYMTLLASYAVLSVFFMVTNRRHVVMNTVMAFGSVLGLSLFLGMPGYLPEGWDWVSGMAAFVILAVFHGAYLLRGKLLRKVYPVYSMVTVLVLALFLWAYSLVQVIPMLLGVVFVLWYVGHVTVKERAPQIVYAVFGALYMMYISLVYNVHSGWAFFTWYAVFTAAAYILYCLTQCRDVAWLGVACFAAFWRFASGEEMTVHIFLLGTTLALFALHSSKVIRRDAALQTAWYVAAFLIAHALRDDLWMQVYRQSHRNAEEINAVFYTLMAVANTAYVHFSTADKEKIMRVTKPAVVPMVLQGYLFLQCMDAVDSRGWFAALLGVVSSMLILSHSLWYTYKTRGQNRKIMVWQFLKFTLYCWAILLILESPSILMHISLLLIAICAIMLGFRLGHKSVRVYGLVLSLLDVVCLVLFNIDFADSLQLAGGIVLCGGLCFVISFLYSRLSRSQAKQPEG